jgi:flavin reductase (DIM6/NTAB) family NADH-FMN oxidoreductase RutF
MTETDTTKGLAAALGRIASGLFVLTARRGELETGMLTSWVQQCSFQPPLVSVAIRKDRAINTWLTDNSSFTLNVLDDTQTDMIVHFGRGFDFDKPAFKGLEVERSADADPILLDALAYLRCRVAGRCSAGDHEVYLGHVISGRIISDGHPMVHIRKSGLHY